MGKEGDYFPYYVADICKVILNSSLISIYKVIFV